MSPGKLASQAGHAYVGALQAASGTLEGQAYTTLSPGTKVALQGNLAQLSRAVESLASAGIPHYAVVDSGCPDFFAGEPILTAVGFGPATRQQVNRIARRLQLL